MIDNKKEWNGCRNEIVLEIANLGFQKELGEEIAKQLGSPKAMKRMLTYLYKVKPKKIELIVDEMLAICSDINRWKEKKASEEANSKYNDMLYYGLDSFNDER